MEDILPILQKRRSVRRYLPKVPSWEQITKVVDAGRMAPTSGNVQDWKAIVCYDPDLRETLAMACVEQEWMVEAPVHIVVCAQPEKAERYYGLRGERLYSVQNCAAAAMCMIMEATSLGLSTCWVGAFEEEAIKRALKCEEYVRPQIVITLGYASEVPAKPPKFPLESMMYMNAWRGKIKDISKVMADYSVKWERNYRKFLEAMKKGVEKGKKKLGI